MAEPVNPRLRGITRNDNGDFLWEIVRPHERSRLGLQEVELRQLYRMFDRAMRRHRRVCRVQVWLITHGVPVSYTNSNRSTGAMVVCSVWAKLRGMGR